MQIYQNTDFYFFRKPHYVASAFWKEKSFLDYIFVDNIDLPNNSTNYDDLDKTLSKYIDQQINNLQIQAIEDKHKQLIIDNLKTIFWESLEYWLLNRLDNDTWGLLYFAKSIEIYDNYKHQQSQNLITKFYIAQVSGSPFYKTDQKEIIVDYPIMHHKFSEDRMIYIQSPWDIIKWSWKQHLVSTRISLLDFDKNTNISTLLVSIHKWIRHQIRVHLSSIGCPIIWENIYSKHKTQDFLHLRSLWFK